MSDTVFFTQSTRQTSFTSSAVTSILRLATAAYTLLREWLHNYRSRRELASYSFDARRDLGFAGELDAEITKPFWKM